LGPRKSVSKRHLDRFIRFCGAHGRDQLRDSPHLRLLAVLATRAKKTNSLVRISDSKFKHTTCPESAIRAFTAALLLQQRKKARVVDFTVLPTETVSTPMMKAAWRKRHVPGVKTQYGNSRTISRNNLLPILLYTRKPPFEVTPTTLTQRIQQTIKIRYHHHHHLEISYTVL